MEGSRQGPRRLEAGPVFRTTSEEARASPKANGQRHSSAGAAACPVRNLPTVSSSACACEAGSSRKPAVAYR